MKKKDFIIGSLEHQPAPTHKLFILVLFLKSTKINNLWGLNEHVAGNTLTIIYYKLQMNIRKLG